MLDPMLGCQETSGDSRRLGRLEDKLSRAPQRSGRGQAVSSGLDQNISRGPSSPRSAGALWGRSWCRAGGAPWAEECAVTLAHAGHKTGHPSPGHPSAWQEQAGAWQGGSSVPGQPQDHKVRTKWDGALLQSLYKHPWQGPPGLCRPETLNRDWFLVPSETSLGQGQVCLGHRPPCAWVKVDLHFLVNAWLEHKLLQCLHLGREG